MSASPISDEGIALLREAIGFKVKIRPTQEVASQDAIMRVAYGNGDDNPLWTDPSYAAKTKYGGLVAPPYYLVSCMSGPYWPELGEYALPIDAPRSGVRVGTGLGRTPNWYVGDEWEWFQPVRTGDRIETTGGLYSVEELAKDPARQDVGRTIEVVWEVLFKNQDGVLVGRMLYKQWKRFKLQSKKKRRGYFSQPDPQYTDADLKAIDKAYENEEIRGEVPRHWEDVEVGEQLGRVVKGPLLVEDMVVWLMGNGSPVLMAHKLRHQWSTRHATVKRRNKYGAVEGLSAAHWDFEASKTWGLPRPSDFGPQRVGFLCHPVTNWMGDDGFMKRLRSEVRGPCMIGDTTWCLGTVTAKRQEALEHVVDIELRCENQRGEVHTKGWATVALPSRSGPPRSDCG